MINNKLCRALAPFGALVHACDSALLLASYMYIEYRLNARVYIYNLLSRILSDPKIWGERGRLYYKLSGVLCKNHLYFDDTLLYAD